MRSAILEGYYKRRNIMAKTTWWKIPGVVPVLIGSLVWGAGSTYWYVCKTDGLCPRHTDNSAQTNDSVQTTSTATTAKTSDDTTSTNTSASSVATNTTTDASSNAATQTNTAKPTTLIEYYYPDSATAISSVDITAFLEYLRAHPTARVSLKAYAANVTQGQNEPSGDTVANERATAVKQAFIANGIATERVTTSTAIANNQLDTTDQQALATARRVEITIQ